MQVCIKNNKKMEKEKYYTPTIEEFHVGFEFEQKERFGDGTVKTKEDFNNAKWISRIMELGEAPYIERMLSGRNALNGICGIRVKYIDREDIESFGFKQMSEEITYFNLNNFNLLFHYTKPIILIDQRIVGSNGGYSDFRVFKGLVKNKSEFSRLLKQLSII